MNFEELKNKIDQARTLGCTSITLEGVTYTIGPSTEPKRYVVPDSNAEDLIKPSYDEITEEEIKYWSSPYYDELQATKQARKELEKEASNFHASLKE